MDESVVREFEQQQVGKLKLSAAIRIGAKLRPQCTGRMFKNGASCALGAAYEAMTGRGYYDLPETDARAAAALAYMYEKADVPFGLSEVFFKNDEGWTREEIADWLESQGL